MDFESAVRRLQSTECWHRGACAGNAMAEDAPMAQDAPMAVWPSETRLRQRPQTGVICQVDAPAAHSGMQLYSALVLKVLRGSSLRYLTWKD